MAKKSQGSEKDGRSQVIKVRDIHAGRDVVMGDQYKLQDQRVADIRSASQFLVELERIQTAIVALKKSQGLSSIDVQTLEVAEGRVREAVEEGKKPVPTGARITSSLDKAKKTMDSLSGGLNAAVGVGKAIEGVIEFVGKLFGG